MTVQNQTLSGGRMKEIERGMTPLTDAFHDGWDCINYPHEAIDFARQLEQDRARLRDALQAIVERCNGNIYQTDQETGETFDKIATAALNSLSPHPRERDVSDPFDCQEFHELMLDYRAHPTGNGSYELVQEYIRRQVESRLALAEEWRVDNDDALACCRAALQAKGERDAG